MNSRIAAAIGLIALVSPIAIASQSRGPDTGISAPELALPPDAPRGPRSSYGSERSAGSAYWLTTSQSLTDVAKHFQTQLTALGWRTTLARADPAIHITRFSFGMDAGARAATLAVLPLDNQLLVNLRVVVPDDVPLPPGRMGRGGANTRGGLPTDSLPIEIENLIRQLPQPPGNERFEKAAALPESFPREMLPTGFKTHSMLTSPSRTTVVGTIAGSSVSEMARFMVDRRKDGWLEVAPSAFWTGLVSTHLCKDARSASLGFLEQPGRVLIVGVSVGHPPVRGCAVGPQRRAPAAISVSIPYLVFPTDWLRSPFMGAGNQANRRWETRLFGLPSLATAQLRLEPQVVAAGFKPVTRINDAVQSIVRFDSIPEAGAPAIVLLSLTTVPGTSQIDVVMEIFLRQGR